MLNVSSFHIIIQRKTYCSFAGVHARRFGGSPQRIQLFAFIWSRVHATFPQRAGSPPRHSASIFPKEFFKSTALLHSMKTFQSHWGSQLITALGRSLTVCRLFVYPPAKVLAERHGFLRYTFSPTFSLRSATEAFPSVLATIIVLPDEEGPNSLDNSTLIVRKNNFK
jgi:hypothetical protein